MDYWKLVNYSHLLVLAPLFVYLGYRDGKVVTWMYPLILALGIGVVVYHVYLAVKNYRENNSTYIVNLFHALLIGPLLIYVGHQQNKTTYPMPTLMYILGIGAFFHFAKKIGS